MTGFGFLSFRATLKVNPNIAILTMLIKTQPQIVTILNCHLTTIVTDIHITKVPRILTNMATMVALNGTKMLYSSPPLFQGINLDPPGPTALFFFLRKFDRDMSL